MVRVSGVNRVEYAAEFFWRDTNAIIFDRDYNTLLFPIGSDYFDDAASGYGPCCIEQ